MKDPYSILGVSRTASEEEIRKAFRGLAKKYHPDTGTKDPTAEKRYKEITAAYDLLSDAKKRKQFDNGEIDANGQQRAYHDASGFEGFGGPQGGGTRREFRFNFGGNEERPNFDNLFADFFGGNFDQQQRGARGGVRGQDSAYALKISFEEAALGGTRRLTLPGGRTLDVKIPAGVREGQQIRLKGQGESGRGVTTPGDALITIEIEPHAFFKREGRDVHVDVPVSLKEAVLGAKIEVPTLHGPVTMSISPNSNTGATYRLKGKGVAASGAEHAGDQLVHLLVALPERGDPDLTDFVSKWTKNYNPRSKLKKG
jgi:DnaJ-class molecular chaperone